jgi:Photosynthesis affected mutant 68
MARRMAIFSGVPTFLGMMTFVVSYFLVKQTDIDLPPSVVLLVSMGCFGLGVVGLSYGLLSASWDEDNVGSLLGTEQFGVNFGRLRAGWKEGRQQKKG